jgi:CBS domain-containing protein/uncharacterized protein (DUF2267 family)
MNLEKYCRDRMVVLNARASAYDAACAMKNNHVGAIPVHARGELVGILTDRDLALKVVARDLPPRDVEVGMVMTPDPVTIEVTDTEDDAAELMRAMHVRRLIVLDEGRLAGIVTLDDLILSGAANREQVRSVILEQLSEQAPAKPEGLVRPARLRRYAEDLPQRRSHSRRQQTLAQFAARLMAHTGLADRDQALAAFQVVAAGIARRLMPAEAKDFAAQLPYDIREFLLDLPRGPDRRVTRQSIQEDMARRLDVDLERAAELVSRVGAAMGELISAGELDDVVSQLPRSLRPLLRHAA